LSDSSKQPVLAGVNSMLTDTGAPGDTRKLCQSKLAKLSLLNAIFLNI